MLNYPFIKKTREQLEEMSREELVDYAVELQDRVEIDQDSRWGRNR